MIIFLHENNQHEHIKSLGGGVYLKMGQVVNVIEIMVLLYDLFRELPKPLAKLEYIIKDEVTPPLYLSLYY